ncbi:MAG: BON domain-containing protein [Acidobacteria bacterium]|nr:BON domain-containing protein [Acidobacteriota bacterium]
MKRLLLLTFVLTMAGLLSVDCTRESSEAAKGAIKDAGGMVAESAKKVGEDTKAVAGTIESATTDATITAAVKMKLVKDASVSAMDIDVDTKDGMVTLSGEVSSKAEVDKAVELASSVSGVKMVHSNLAIHKK